eukprot:TRINITY_DN48913_c0_g1_i1.p1 TRINITY_DN48913_c0_g1~~TRINITY_DN48913_c0_g1_i1.p1  ORF type:complete len:134 (-),score=11.53 TRINITY_DN48913_c0_g1_i1:206-607(-)
MSLVICALTLLTVTIFASQATSLTIICILSSISRLCLTEHGHGARCRPVWDLRGVAIITVGGDMEGKMPASEIVLFKEDKTGQSTCRMPGSLKKINVPTIDITCEIDRGRLPRDEDEGKFSLFSFGDRVFNEC